MKTKSPLSFLAAVAALALTGQAFAISGPQHKSFRPLSMGNAFVALVDDKDALYYNPAGLNLINALGNKSARPELANYPRNRFDARVDLVGASLPLNDLNGFRGFYDKHQNSFKSSDKIRQDSSLFADLAPFDREPIEVGEFNGAVFAMHNYGIAVWDEAQAAPFVDAGVLLPQAGVQHIQIDAAIQLAAAHSFLGDKLSVGIGYTLASRQEVDNYQIASSQLIDGSKEVIRSIKDTLNQKSSNYSDLGDYGHGLDLGALWQQTSWLRLGGSIENLGMFLNHQAVTPNLTVGVAVTPPLLSTGGIFARKVNVAVDFADLLNDDKNYKPLSKVNFGAEVEQSLWWLMSLQVGGGFKGGYWTAGSGLTLFTAIHIEAVSWADETGYYTGQHEDRHYAVNLGLGI